MRVVCSVTLGAGSYLGGNCCGTNACAGALTFGTGMGFCRCKPSVFDQNRKSNATLPKRVNMLNKSIQVMNAGWTFISANRTTLENTTPNPTTIVRPTIRVGAVNLTGAATKAGAFVPIKVRFAPHRLQYLSSTVISFPQEGQYIAPPMPDCGANVPLQNRE